MIFTLNGLGCGDCASCAGERKFACSAAKAGIHGLGEVKIYGNGKIPIDSSPNRPTNYEGRAMAGAASKLLTTEYDILEKGGYNSWFFDKENARVLLDTQRSVLEKVYARIPENGEKMDPSVWTSLKTGLSLINKTGAMLAEDAKVNAGWPMLADMVEGLKLSLEWELSLPEKLFKKVGNALGVNDMSMTTKIAIGAGVGVGGYLIFRYFFPKRKVSPALL